MNFEPVVESNWRRGLANIALFLVIPFIGILDGIAGEQVRLTAFFLIPIMLITWRMGQWLGYLATVAALLNLLILSFLERGPGTSSLLFAVDEVGRFISFFIIVAILSNLRSSYLQQKTIATRDPLTNLYNRLGLQEILAVELETAKRDRRPFAVFFIDCDNFKKVNDKWGHHVGDQLLQALALTLSASIRRSDLACRLGGDEFVVYASHLGEMDAMRFIENVKLKLDAAMRDRHWPVTFSIGAALFEFAPDTFDELIRFADALMYDVKKSGKNNVRKAKWTRVDRVR